MKTSLPIQIDLPEGFLDEEIRCGYTVCEKLKKIWAVELDLLNELTRVCKRHGIKFQLFCGSLLGAERHKGFIPWDDDFDVVFDRRNFRKLCKVADEFNHPYFFQTALTDRKFFLGYARLRNSLTTGAITWEQSPDYNCGIYIDLYVLDGIVGRRVNGLQKNLSRWFSDVAQDLSSGVRRPRGKYLLPHIARQVAYKLGYEFAVSAYNWVLNAACCFTERIGLLTHESHVYSVYWLTKNDFADTEYVNFEFLTVPVSRNRKTILARIYGDYLKFPPIEKLGKWHENMIHFDPDVPYREYLNVTE